MGDSPSIDYSQSPWQTEIQGWIRPYMQNLYGGQMPDLYNVPGLPDAASYFAKTMPTGDWWANLDPSIRAGISAPYVDASQQMMEQMSSEGGMRGGMRGGGQFGGGRRGGRAGTQGGTQSGQ